MISVLNLQPQLSGNEQYWLGKCLELAKLAGIEGEVPVGAVIVKDNKLVASGYNTPIKQNDPSAHAEIIALRQAGINLNNYRLNDCELYVTLEPCVMCLGAILHARIKRVIFGAYDPKTGALGGKFDLLALNKFNHNLEVVGGVRADECSTQLRNFFKSKR